MLNQEWKQCPLGEVLTLQRGFDLPHSRRRPGTIPVVTSSGVSDWHSEWLVPGPGVVTGRYGTIGQVFFVEEDFWPHNTTLFVKDFKGNDPLFISFLLRTIDFQTHSGKSGVPGVNRNDLHELIVQLPPPSEQRAIAIALNDVDALLAGLDRLIEKMQAIKQGAMQELLTGKRRLPGFSGESRYKQTEVGVIPEDWEVRLLGDLFSFSGGFSASRDQLSSKGHCYLHYGDIHKSSRTFIDVRVEYQDIPKLDIPLRRVSSASLLNDGDVVFVDASEDDEGTSKHVVVINKEGTTYISGLHTIVAKSTTDALDHAYRRYCFQTRDVKRQFYFYSVGTKVSGISKTNIAKIFLPLPSPLEQRAIATILSDMDAEIAALEARRDKTRLLKQGMMQELLTGRVQLVKPEKMNQ